MNGGHETCSPSPERGEENAKGVLHGHRRFGVGQRVAGDRHVGWGHASDALLRGSDVGGWAVAHERPHLGRLGPARPALDRWAVPVCGRDRRRGRDGCRWGHGSPVIADHQLDLSENWQVIAFMVSGRIGSHHGSGTLSFLLPALTADEQAQVCTMGELTWMVDRTAREDFPFRPAVPMQGDGRTITMPLGAAPSERTTALAQADDRSIRHYGGRTSQGLSMAAQTSRTDTGFALLRLSWEYVLACDDGSELRGGGDPLMYFEATVVMPPGRLDLDFGPVPTLDMPAVAFHFHGELDAHSGSGTSTMTWPVITENLQAQLCRSGEQTWELWRTDAGY